MNVPLKNSDVRLLLHTLGLIEEAVLHPNFQMRLVEQVSELVPGSIIAFEEIDLMNKTHRLHHTTPFSGLELQSLLASLERLHMQNPVHVYFANGGKEKVLNTLSLTTRAKFEKTEFYQEIFKPLGIKHQMVLRLERQGWISTLTLNRDQRFDDELANFLKALAPFIDRAQRINQELVRLRGKISGVDNAIALTPREMEVASWMREGKRNREIGLILGCSEKTVEKHVQKILEKTCAETRSAAVRSIFS